MGTPAIYRRTSVDGTTACAQRVLIVSVAIPAATNDADSVRDNLHPERHVTPRRIVSWTLQPSPTSVRMPKKPSGTAGTQ